MQGKWRKTRNAENTSVPYQRNMSRSTSGNGWQFRKEKEGETVFIIFLSYHENQLSPLCFELLHLTIAAECP